jgi:exopolysaccharide biosynthesis polyprenyl glycosylphosphotransferase
MIRLFHVYFPTRTLVLSVSEVCLIVLGFLFVSVAWSANEMELWLSYDNGLLKIAVVSTVLMVCMYYYDLYDSTVLGNQRETLARLFQVFGTASVILALLYFVFPEARLGRASFVLGIGLAGLGLACSRRLFLTLNRSGRLADRVAILGDGSLAISLAREIEKRPELGMRVLGLVSQSGEAAICSNELRHLGKIEDLPPLIDNEQVTRLIIATDDRDEQFPVTQLQQLKNRGLMIVDGAALYEKTTGKVFLDASVLNWVLSSFGSWPSPALLVYKRTTSIVFSLLGLVLCAPLMAVIAFVVRADSEGPILFRQRRVGKDGRTFTLYKFRSMRSEVAKEGSFKTAQVDDERFTRLGRWLRRTRLDEMPQLYNILRGDMDLVGPRPFALEEEEKLAEQIPHYRLRWTITPGATGWAQIQLGYCASIEDNTEKLAHDLFYLQNLSVGLDLLILLRTTKILLWGRGAR